MKKIDKILTFVMRYKLLLTLLAMPIVAGLCLFLGNLFFPVENRYEVTKIIRALFVGALIMAIFAPLLGRLIALILPSLGFKPTENDIDRWMAIVEENRKN